MPVGEYSKDQIRAIAAELALPVANKPDSQEICFVTDNDYAGFIADYIKDNKHADALNRAEADKNGIYTGLTPGNFVNTAGEVIGKHKGYIHYTVGQRKGLGIAMGQPVFVKEIRPQTNEVVLCNSDEVFSDRLLARNVNFMAIEGIDGELEAEVKIRYSHKGAKCVIRQTGEDEVMCIFEEPQRAITPGQAVVFYQGDYVLGGGTIVKD
jgi:tRNA-specific 2-thiouridylase